ncbi:MAG: hypothetical protein JWN53_389, partial [Gemmatimonadetes bacterium]|nr:hypothetical protein [Gemmatimonadota bacterium]
GCSEQVTGSLGCPDLCTDQSAQLRDTTLVGAVVLDSTLMGYPELGATRDMALVAQGDTADVRLVARFDSLPRTYVPVTATPDSNVKFVDSAQVKLLIDTTFARPTIAVTIQAFDVDTTADDTTRASLVPLFRNDRLIGTTILQPADTSDTLRVTISNAAVLDKITNGTHLRIGLRISAAAPVKLHIAGNSVAPYLRYRISSDTTIAAVTVALHSATPADNTPVANALLFYPVIASPLQPQPASDRIAVGGIAGARTYIKFDIPAIVLDSVQVIRGTLQLNQLPTRVAGGGKDTLTLYVQPVVASPLVTDVATAIRFLASPTLYGIGTSYIVAGDSGQRDLEIVNLVRAWRAFGTKNTQRAVVLRSLQEGSAAGELDFTSSDGLLALRPRLRLTYVPRRGFGLP